MKKRMTIMIIALLIVFGGIIAFNFIKGIMIQRFVRQFQAVPLTVSSVKVMQKTWQPTISAVGNFVAVNGVEINSEEAGQVVAIHFESGQYVEKGMPLVDLNDTVEQAQLKFERANKELRDVSYKRQVTLSGRGATPITSVDEAKASLEQAQANVEKIEAQIRNKHIIAPFSGKLGIRQINLGQYVTPGQTAIVTLQSMDPLYLEFNLPEQFFKKLHLRQKVQLSLEEFPNLLFQGEISAINSKVDPNTHNILVQATVPNCPAQALQTINKTKLLTVKNEENGNKKIIQCNTDINTKNHINQFVFIPGMFAAIYVEQPSIPNVLVLPSTAISYSLYGNSVFLIEKTSEKDKAGKDIFEAKRVFVETGEQEGNYTIIKNGLKPGQLVVGSGELKLQDRSRITINNDIKLDTTVNPDLLGQ
ncbi:acriflavin resistance protein [Legionella busanensis]|uniref:Acriflavin resistance protein n=1 Tax=Legionella busanensis TaxID=190655 RepID=A0A378JLT9_9GAMM|nr:efflux RND transporter periplasmic adaptor subunit [Legionella busanensis]STX52184.1 acriflavin resistance protein [Legionella busanensis]